MVRIFILLFLAGLAGAQEFQIDSAMLQESAGGARAAAMGRAFTAVADDATALHWNPAGLADFNQSCGVINGMLNFGTLGLVPDGEFFIPKDYEGRYAGGFSLNYIGFTIPLTGAPNHLVGSIVIRNLSDLNQSFTIISRDKNSQDENRRKINRTGGIFALSTGAGLRLLPNLRVGTNFNFITGQQLKETVIKDDYSTGVTRQWEKWKNKFSGFSMDVGFIWNPVNAIAVGSKFTLPYAMHYSDIEYEDSLKLLRNYDTDISLEKPFFLTCGIGLYLTDNFIFSFDYAVRPWKNMTAHVDGEKNTDIFENADSFHMGVEYTVDAGQYKMPWRFGFFSYPVQVYEYDSAADDHLGDQVISHFLTAGFGIEAKTFLFDVAFDYQMLQYKTLLDGQMMPVPFDYRLSRFTLVFGMGLYL